MIEEPARFGIVIVAMIIMIFSLYWRIKNSNRKAKASDSNTRPFKNNQTNEEIINYHEKENDILLRIAQAEREFNAKIDSRITLLNVLIENADKSIMELKTLQAGGKSKPVGTPSAGDVPRQEQIHAKIKQLHDAGLSSTEIASHLKMMEGEVNLTLSLLKKKYDG